MDYIKKHSTLLLVFLLSLLPIVNLLTPGLLITHDSLDHVVRVANFYQSLSEGIIIPRWAGNLNWGYGHPVLMFLYPLPSYIMSVFHFLDISYVNSFKLLIAASYSLSGIFMYLWLSRFLNKYAALLGATLYLFAPYRFVDIYVRGAIGEHVAFMFMPLVLLALYKLFNSNKHQIRDYYLNFIFVSASFALLILSHNAISLLFIPFIIFYIFYLFLENKSKQKFLLSFFSLGFGFLFSFFFWFPAFIEGKYTLRDIVAKKEYIDRFVEIKDLIYGIWNYGGTGQFTTQLGLIQIILVIASIFFLITLFKSKDKIKFLFLGTIIFLLFSVFLMLKESNFIWENITTLQKLQFPWRLLAITSFYTALTGSILLDKVRFKSKNLIIGLLIIFAIIPTLGYWHANEYKIINDTYLMKPFPSTTDTGESSPIWSTRSMDEYPKDGIEILDGNSEIVKVKGNSTYHEYIIDAKTKTRIKENTLYFPGWKIYDNNNLLTNIEFQDPANRGVMTFYIEPGLHNIVLIFEDTKIRKISNYISLTSIFLVLIFPIIFIIFSKLKINKYKW